MKVEELMTKEVLACRPDESLGHAARIMWEHDCGCVPVVDDDRVVGVVTDRDALMAAYTQGRPLDQIPVTTAMAREVFACHPDDSLASAERVLRDAQVHRLP